MVGGGRGVKAVDITRDSAAPRSPAVPRLSLTMIDGAGLSPGSVHGSLVPMIDGGDSGLDDESAEEMDDTMHW